MGFYPEPEQYHITFPEGDKLHGLEVTMSSLSVGEYNSMMRRAMVKGLTEETLKANDEMIDLLASKLVEWNLEDKDGQPVPHDRDAISAQDRTLIGKIIVAWQFALVGISESLGKDSTNGALSQEESLALGKSSVSLPS